MSSAALRMEPNLLILLINHTNPIPIKGSRRVSVRLILTLTFMDVISQCIGPR